MLIISDTWNMIREEVLRLPITQFKRKLELSIKYCTFRTGGELDLKDSESYESKIDAEYNYLKSIGAL